MAKGMHFREARKHGYCCWANEMRIFRYFGVTIAMILPLASVASQDAPSTAQDLLEAIGKGPPNAVPSNNPALWAGESDYPPSALRAEQSGDVGIKLYVNDAGRAAACFVERSSQVIDLDNAACDAAMRHARFVPRPVLEGQTYAGLYKTTIHWKLDQDAPSSGDASADARGAADRSKWDALRLYGPFPTTSEISARCGTAPSAPSTSPDEGSYTGTGITPATLAHVITVSPAQARCMLEAYPGKVFVADAAGSNYLPDAADFRFAAVRTSSDSDAVQKRIATFLGEAVPGAHNVPILVYCHHSSCGLSVVAAQRIVKLGYTEVFWMREGMNGWQAAGYPVWGKDSRWTQPITSALQAWRACLGKQPTGTQSDSAEVLADIKMRACAAFEAATLKSVGPWYPEGDAQGLIASTRAETVASTKRTLDGRVVHAKILAAEEEEDAKWRRLSAQIASAPASQVHVEYQWCSANQFGGGDGRFYLSPVIGVRVPNLDDAEAMMFDSMRRSARSGPDKSFAAYLKARSGPDSAFTANCSRSTTRESADRERAKFMAGRNVVETSWVPAPTR